MDVVIVVAGEALVDLVIGVDGAVDAALGGAPYNTARAAARLGAGVIFVGGLSRDRFGTRLADQLAADGVAVGFSHRSERPSTLAAAEIDERGSATYRFYLEGTAAPTVSADDVLVAVAEADGSPGSTVFFTGGLGLVLEPMASSILAAVDALAPNALFVLDVNCRPAVIEDRAAYLDRIRRAVRRADIVKVSDEDLAYLSPGLDPPGAARELLGHGARVVVVTAGESHTTVLDRDDAIDVAVPPIRGGVVDTIGAGDTFGAGLIAWWDASRLGRDDVSVDAVAAGVRAGHAAAGIVVSRRGADPPHLRELAIEWPAGSGATEG